MTNSVKPPAMIRMAELLATVGGLALVADTVTITVLNRAFDPLDSILFLTGLAALLGTGFALAAHQSSGQHGLLRVLQGVLAFLVMLAAAGAVAAVFDAFGRHVFSAANKGLHGEWSFFSVGVCLLLVGWSLSRREWRADAPVV